MIYEFIKREVAFIGVSNVVHHKTQCQRVRTQLIYIPENRSTCAFMFDWWGGPIMGDVPPYQPNMYSIALLTTPVLRVGVFVPGTTLCSPCASLEISP